MPKFKNPGHCHKSKNLRRPNILRVNFLTGSFGSVLIKRYRSILFAL